jgi:hypothetical protein
MVQPLIYLCGSVLHGAGFGLPNQSYCLCGPCALWLGYGEPRFPQGLCFNFTESQAKRIADLREEMKLLQHPPSPGEAILSLPNAQDLTAIRMRLVPEHVQQLVDALSRGDVVDPTAMEKADRR